MLSNVGSLDRILRFIAAFITGSLYVAGIVTGTVGILLFVVAAVFMLTSLFGFCPIYKAFGICTLKKTAR